MQSSDYPDAVHMLLEGWRELEPLRQILHATLTLLTVDDKACMTDFAVFERFRGSIVLPPKDPQYLEWMSCVKLLEVQDAYPNGVRALAILLLMFDGRVRKLFLSQSYIHDRYCTQPPSRTTAFNFLHETQGVKPLCYEFITRIKDPTVLIDPAREKHAIDTFVTTVAKFYRHGGLVAPLHLPSAPPQQSLFAELDDDAMDIDQ